MRGCSLIYTICILLGQLVLSGCSVLDPAPASTYRFDTLYVEHVAVPDTISLNHILSIKVQGFLPDPSWEFDRFELNRQETGLTILPIGKQDLRKDASCQVLIPFTAAAPYRPENTGRLKVVVQGKNETLETEVIVVAHGPSQGENNVRLGTRSALHRTETVQGIGGIHREIS